MNTLYVDTKQIMHKSLNALATLLEKIQGQIGEDTEKEQALINGRLAPDMFTFARQVQITTDNAKGAMSRLSGSENPVMEDTEQTLAELIARVKKTAEFVKNTSNEELQTADERKMTLSYFPGKFQTAEDYTRDHAIPNFYFHFVAAYAIIRMQGYEIGKADFIGGLNLQDM